MPEFQFVVSNPETGKAYKIEGGAPTSLFIGKRIGDVMEGDTIGLRGYKLEITGGSDKEGTPMRRDVSGAARKRILITSGTGYRSKEKGKRKRKSVRGKEISTEISQINVKITEHGGKPIEELFKEEDKEEGNRK
jgi:small subunit ribosomal protein S6e